jgi:hypothetical protein
MEFPVAFLHTHAEQKKLTRHRHFLLSMAGNAHTVAEHIPLSQVAIVPWGVNDSPMQISGLPRPLLQGHSYHITACNNTTVVGVDNPRIQQLENDVQPAVDFSSDLGNQRSFAEIFASSLPAVEVELSEATQSLDAVKTASYMLAAGTTSAFVPVLPQDVVRYDTVMFTNIAWSTCPSPGATSAGGDVTLPMHNVRRALTHHRSVMLAIGCDTNKSFAGYTPDMIPALPRSIFIMRSWSDAVAIIAGVLHLHFTAIQCKTAQLKHTSRPPRVPSLAELLAVSIAPVRRTLQAVCPHPIDSVAEIHAIVCEPFRLLLPAILQSIQVQIEMKTTDTCWSSIKLLRFMVALDQESENMRVVAAASESTDPMFLPSQTFPCACGTGTLHFPKIHVPTIERRAAAPQPMMD